MKNVTVLLDVLYKTLVLGCCLLFFSGRCLVNFSSSVSFKLVSNHSGKPRDMWSNPSEVSTLENETHTKSGGITGNGIAIEHVTSSWKVWCILV